MLIVAYSNAQGKLERYSCKTPSVTVDYNYLSYNGTNYDCGVYFSFNTFNCRWLTCGFESIAIANYQTNTGNNLSVPSVYYYSTAGINQPPFSGRAYVTTADGKFYSSYVLFSVAGTLPSLSTVSASSIGTGDAYSGGTISSDGGNPISGKGVVWGYDSSVSLDNYIGITSDGTGSSSYASHITGLSQGTSYYVKAYATTTIGTGYGNAIQFTTQQSVHVPTVTTADINSINQTSAYSGGIVSYSGGGSITERGVCWNTSGSPNVNNSKTTNGTGTGSFSSFIENLTPNTTYYVRAYAKACGMVNGFNVCATGYGDELSFTTLPSGSCDLPTVTTNTVNSITTNSASGGGNVTSDGGCEVTANGVCWSTSPNPTTANSHTIDGSGLGAFSSSLTGLTCGTTYYVRSYATNSSGTAYGNQVSFMTTSSATATITGFSSVTSTSFTANCRVTSSCSNITSRGIIYSTSSGVTYPTNAQSCGSGTGTYDCTPYATLSPNTTYYVKSYVIVNGSAIYLSLESTVTTLAIPPVDPCTLSVGDSYGGGIVAYVFQSGDLGYVSGECHGIIAATSDQSSGIQWYNGTYVDISTLSSDLHAGTTNTNDILYVHGYNYIDYAAGLARSYSGGGFSDWCLPSLNDLLKLYDNRLSVGGFSASRYWASGQRFGSAIASMVDFINGDYSQDYNKAFLYHVRAIRYF